MCVPTLRESESVRGRCVRGRARVCVFAGVGVRVRVFVGVCVRPCMRIVHLFYVKGVYVMITNQPTTTSAAGMQVTGRASEFSLLAIREANLH